MRGCVVNLVGHGSCIMGHGSVFVWVSGSWVTACDPLFTLMRMCIFIHRSGRNKKNIHSDMQQEKYKRNTKNLSNKYLTIIKLLTNDVSRMLTSVNKLLLLH